MATLLDVTLGAKERGSADREAASAPSCWLMTNFRLHFRSTSMYLRAFVQRVSLLSVSLIVKPPTCSIHLIWLPPHARCWSTEWIDAMKQRRLTLSPSMA